MVLILHAAAIALVMLSRSAAPVSTKPGLIAFDIADAGAPRLSRPRPHHAPIAVASPIAAATVLKVTAIDLVDSLPDISPIGEAMAQEAPAAIDGGCDLTQTVQDALQHSDAVRRQLPAIPTDLRSVANAVVVWNAGWIESGAGPAQAAFAAVRQTIAQTVAAASADCRSQPQLGPRLIYLSGETSKTTVLALGSGQWSWQQLVDGAPPPAQLAAAPVTVPMPKFGMSVAPAQARTPALNALLASLVRKRSPTALPYYP